MSSFTARLQLPGQTRLPLNVEVDIADELMTLSTGGRTVATWPLDQLQVSAVTDGFHIRIDGEELILSPDDSGSLARALGMDEQAVDRGKAGVERPPSAAKLNGAAFAELRFEDLRSKVREVEEALASDVVPPPEAFRRWLRLLKEMNDRHGHGSLPTHMFCELNARLLELIPEPARQLEAV